MSVDKVIEWRRHIHQNPELSFQETGTSAYVAGILESFGNIEVRRPTPTSVIGILNGARPGRKVAFRADIDALPVHEETGLTFASRVDGVSHACGHDAHTAMLLGAADALSRMREEISGTVYFVFQHAEELDPGGAREIVESGALKDIEAIFGLHVFPNYPSGHVGIFPKGPASTAVDNFFLIIEGKGTHGAMPQAGVDPIVTGAQIVIALQTIVSRNVKPGEMAVVTVGKFQSGSAPNVIPGTARLEGTVRTVTDETRQLAADRVKALIDNIARANGASYSLDYVTSHPAVHNDAGLAGLAKSSAVKALSAGCVFDAPRMSGSEDFAWYREQAPGCMIILGVGPGSASHSPQYNLDESALENGVKTEVQIILDFLNQK